MTKLGLGLMILLGSLIALFFIAMFLSSAFHQLVALRHRCKSAYAQLEIASGKNQISSSRQAYNDAVKAYNTRRGVFPSNIIARIFRFEAAELFTIDRSE